MGEYGHVRVNSYYWRHQPKTLPLSTLLYLSIPLFSPYPLSSRSTCCIILPTHPPTSRHAQASIASTVLVSLAFPLRRQR